jgi:hypothetical protein
MHGSPTLLINGHDPFPTPHDDHALSCRIYRDEHDQPTPAPSPAQLRNALAARVRSAEHRPADNPARAYAVLSAWRSRAQPADLLEKTIHQAILRTFATTGQPPGPAALETLTTGSARNAASVLTALHDLDAIRLGPDATITVAYPFSTAPTRHRVQISNRVEVYAMCAIDALGIAAMLDENTRIDSTDPTTGHSVTVTTARGTTNWQPAEAVVFLGATAGGGPSADYCCDHLNFFTDHTAATAWTTSHPDIPGEILTHTQAEQLGARLFAALLATT